MSEKAKRDTRNSTNVDERIDVKLYEPHYHQKLVHYYCSPKQPQTFIFAKAGRQSGKSLASKYQLIWWAMSIPRARIMYVAPTLQQVVATMDEVFNGIINSGLVSNVNKGNTAMWMRLTNGTYIYFRSASQADSLRGYTLTHLILDEASFVREDIFTTVLLPFLNTKVEGIKSKILVCSTPKGKTNWFYAWCERARNCTDNSMAYVEWNSFDNPAADLKMLELWKNNMPEQQYRQEILGDWLDQFQLFSGIDEAAVLESMTTEPVPGDRYTVGVDIGVSQDWTVATVMNHKGDVVHIYRFRLLQGNKVKGKLAEIINKWRPVKILIEENNQGSIIISDLKIDHRIANIEGFNTSQSSKEDLILTLQSDFEKQKIKIPKPTVFRFLFDELKDFSAIPTKSGRMRYECLSGHDDCVMSLALANLARHKVKTSKITIKY